MERFGMGGDRRRYQPDVRGQRGDPGGDEHRVQPAAYLVGALVGPGAVGGLEGEGVLERDEVQQPALGFEDGVGPVAGGEQLPGTGPGLPPGGRMPAGVVECDGEVQRVQGCGHGAVAFLM
ncbi:hypothetical protein M2266_000389 [Streptomyces sp. SPB162]|nr:hypothetical protein [Streptomyces sp. SPB162]